MRYNLFIGIAVSYWLHSNMASPPDIIISIISLSCIGITGGLKNLISAKPLFEQSNLWCNSADSSWMPFG